ncbi:hypothetical protein [Parendozoicomonas sp. Alg238-R29]|uniref:hypothetical protein n=1 Tax=Parendozoicomonas sp. Alg238-R29 TaxID=2993446 RepID=UPI00248F1CFB|nr:hypothetical protein [Parendozoicomonas sp. Alg238-R29]
MIPQISPVSNTADLSSELSRVKGLSGDKGMIRQQFHSFLLSEVCKESLRVNKTIAADTPLSLSKQTALTETFWNQVISTISAQADWGLHSTGEVVNE